MIKAAHEHSISLLIDIVEVQHQQKAYLELVRAKRIDGLILSGPRFDDDALLSLQQEHFPTVLMGQLPDTDFFSVDIDNFTAAQQAVGHLVNLGHERIACITNAALSYTAAADRMSGYREILSNHGISYDESLVRYGDFDPESGYQQMKELLAHKQLPTAVFVASDVVAIGAKAAIVEMGMKIPEDIALVGFDDVPLARYLDPPLTTVRLPASELATRASQMLIQLIKGETPFEKVVLLESQLIVRQSCGANLPIH